MNSLPPLSATEDELHWLALRMVPGLGTRRIGLLLERLRTPQAIFRASTSELEAAGLTGAVARSVASGCSFEDAASQQQKIRDAGARADYSRRCPLSGAIAEDLRSAACTFCARPRGVALLAVASGWSAPGIPLLTE